MRMGTVALAGSAALLAGCGSPASESKAQPSQLVAASPQPTAAATRQASGAQRRILAFGDSLFAGYRLNPGEGYPERLQAALTSRGVNAQVTNAGVSGDTTAAGRARIAFVLDSLDTPPDLAIVELGGNDLLRGIPPSETRSNLAAILAELQKREIPVLLMGMRAPPNMGTGFLAEFQSIYPALAEQYDAELVPFFMEPLLADPTLVLPDRIHPTAAGVQAMVDATLDEVVAALPDA